MLRLNVAKGITQGVPSTRFPVVYMQLKIRLKVDQLKLSDIQKQFNTLSIVN